MKKFLLVPSMVCLGAFAAYGQADSASRDPFATPLETPQDVTPVTNAVTNNNPEAYGFERWLDMKTATFSLRYRNVADTDGLHEYEQGSQRTIADGRFKFDAEGKYSLAFHASSGHYFDWAYSDFAGGGLDEVFGKTMQRMQPGDAQNLSNAFVNYPSQIVGIRSGGWSLYVRRLYLDMKPVKQVELQVGSLDIDRGAGSEITSYDEDGYIDGERLLLHDPKHLYFDQVSFTYAYLGDLFQPNFFARTGRMAQGNYRQFMIQKAFGKRIDASADFTDTRATQTFRQAAFLKIPEAKVIDSLRFESYERIKDVTFDNFPFSSGSGWAVTFSKSVKNKVSTDFGVANLDWSYDVYTKLKIAAILGYSLNGDSYNTGQHWFVRPTIHLTKDFSASALYSRMFNFHYNADGYLWNKENLQFSLTYNFTDMFHRGALN